MSKRLPAVLLVVGLTVACGGTSEPPPLEGCVVKDNPVFTLGTGEEEFAPLDDGQELQMAAGPQGGCHFWIAGKTDGFAERRFNVRYDVRYADSGMSTGSSSSLRIRLQEDESEPGQCQFAGFTAFLIKPWEFRDQSVIIDVTVEDDLGRTAMASRTVTARWPDAVAGTDIDSLCGDRN